MSTTLTTRPGSALKELSTANAKELVRDGKTMFFVLLFPLFFLALFGFLGFTIDAQSPPAKVAVVASAQAQDMVNAAEAKGLSAAVANGAGASDATALVRVEGDSATVTLAQPEAPSWRPVVAAIAETGIPRTHIAVGFADGSPVSDPLKTSLPSILMVSFLSLAFLGTAVPLVSLRGKGTLRLLGTTPLKRSTFIASQSPIRLILGVAQFALVVGSTYALGYLEATAIPRLAVTALIGLLMLFAIGYLIGSRGKNPEATTMGVSLMLPVALMLSGAVIPLSIFPSGVADVLAWIPTTILADALAVDLVGAAGRWDTWVSWLVMIGIGAIAALAAVRLFRWDQGEKR